MHVHADGLLGNYQVGIEAECFRVLIDNLVPTPVGACHRNIISLQILESIY